MSDSKSPSERFYQTGVLCFQTHQLSIMELFLINVARWYSGNQGGRRRAFVWGLPRLSGGMSTCLNKTDAKEENTLQRSKHASWEQNWYSGTIRPEDNLTDN